MCQDRWRFRVSWRGQCFRLRLRLLLGRHRLDWVIRVQCLAVRLALRLRSR